MSAEPRKDWDLPGSQFEHVISLVCCHHIQDLDKWHLRDDGKTHRKVSETQFPKHNDSQKGINHRGRLQYYE